MLSHDGVTLGSLARVCRTKFQEIIASSKSETQHAADLQITKAIQDGLGRFLIWCGNIGVLKFGRGSLDDRLSIKEAAPLVTQIRRVLDDLCSSLCEVSSIASGQRAARDDESDDFDESYQDGQFSEGSSACSEDTGFSANTSEVTLLLDAIDEQVTTLLRYSIAIRKASSQDIFRKASRTVAWDPTFDVNHVIEKWPKLAEKYWLAQRLGKATTIRRQFFHYRSQHREKLSSDDVEVAVARSESEGTKATTLIAEGISDPTLLDDVESDGDFSTTTYDTAVGDDSKKILRVPPAPAESLDCMPFECPFCFRIITVKSEISWKRHVYRDLRPYSCTHKDCDSDLFPSRHEWFAHELSEHYEERQCCFCPQTYLSKPLILSHLNSSHRNQFTAAQEPTVISSCQSTGKFPSLGKCPFCSLYQGTDRPSSQTSLKAFRSHVGRHMEQLALHALPRATHVEVDDDMDEDTSIKSLNSETAPSLPDESSKVLFREEQGLTGDSDKIFSRVQQPQQDDQSSQQATETGNHPEAASSGVSHEAAEHISFTDSLGRKFQFPWRLCRTWKMMEDLILQAYEHLTFKDKEPVVKRQYKLVKLSHPHPSSNFKRESLHVGPGDNWEANVRPGDHINMVLWNNVKRAPQDGQKEESYASKDPKNEGFSGGIEDYLTQYQGRDSISWGEWEKIMTQFEGQVQTNEPQEIRKGSSPRLSADKEQLPHDAHDPTSKDGTEPRLSRRGDTMTVDELIREMEQLRKKWLEPLHRTAKNPYNGEGNTASSKAVADRNLNAEDRGSTAVSTLPRTSTLVDSEGHDLLAGGLSPMQRVDKGDANAAPNLNDHNVNPIETVRDTSIGYESVQTTSYMCSYEGCDRKETFQSPEELQKHLWSAHNRSLSGERYYTCASNSCKNKDMVFALKRDFVKHMNETHADEDPRELLQKSKRIVLETHGAPLRLSSAQSEGKVSTTNLEVHPRDQAQASSELFYEELNNPSPPPETRAQGKSSAIAEVKPSSSRDSGSEINWEQRLNTMCHQQGLGSVSYRSHVMNRPGGGRSWTCIIKVEDSYFHSRNWYQGSDDKEAVNDAAEVAYRDLFGAWGSTPAQILHDIDTTSKLQGRSPYPTEDENPPQHTTFRSHIRMCDVCGSLKGPYHRMNDPDRLLCEECSFQTGPNAESQLSSGSRDAPEREHGPAQPPTSQDVTDEFKLLNAESTDQPYESPTKATQDNQDQHHPQPSQETRRPDTSSAAARATAAARLFFADVEATEPDDRSVH